MALKVPHNGKSADSHMEQAEYIRSVYMYLYGFIIPFCKRRLVGKYFARVKIVYVVHYSPDHKAVLSASSTSPYSRFGYIQ